MQRGPADPSPPHVPTSGLTAWAQPCLLVLGSFHCILGRHLSCTQVPRDLGVEGDEDHALQSKCPMGSHHCTHPRDSYPGHHITQGDSHPCRGM